MRNIIQRNVSLRLFGAGGPPEINSRFRVVAACLLLSACNGSDPVALELNGIPSRQISASVGQELNFKLQTIGPGSYASPPNIEGTAVRFLDASIVSPYVPAGPTQVFRFEAVEPGRAILWFHNPIRDKTVSDTVVVG